MRPVRFTRRARREAREAHGRRTRRSALVGFGLAAVAGAITALTPAPWHAEDSFVTSGDVGETLTAREYVVRVDEVVRADRLIADDEARTGTWLAVHVSAAAVTSEVGAELGLVRARIGDRVFFPAANIDDTLVGENLLVGIGTAGWVVFELPDDTAADALDLEFVDGPQESLRGSVIAVHAAAVDAVAEVEVTRPEIGEAP